MTQHQTQAVHSVFVSNPHTPFLSLPPSFDNRDIRQVVEAAAAAATAAAIHFTTMSEDEYEYAYSDEDDYPVMEESDDDGMDWTNSNSGGNPNAAPMSNAAKGKAILVLH